MENIETEENTRIDSTLAVRLSHFKENEGEGFDCEFTAEEVATEPIGKVNGLFFDGEVFDHLTTDAMGSDDEEDDESDQEDDSGPFNKLKKKMEDISPDGQGGVWKMVVNNGTGPVVPNGYRIQVHYNSYLEYSDEPMDSTRLRSETKKFILGNGEVIEGMELAISTMRQGELSKFLIAPEFAYGKYGCGKRIPPDSEILMEIELISFSSRPSAADFEGAIKKVRTEKEALKFLDSLRLRDEEDEKEMRRLKLKLCLNIALTSIKLGQGRHVISQAKRALEIDPQSDKALYRLAKGFRLIKEFDRAEFYLTRASKLCPNDYHINAEKQELARAKQQFKFLETESYSRMFKDMNINDTKPRDKPIPSSTSSPAAPEFQKSVEENLLKFLEQTDVEEMPVFQLNQMSEGERLFVENKARELGLEARYVQKMDEKCLRIGKKKTPDE
ncbi:inactive peptidyl-prolyl cis-trans isomerase FKBP6-like isoform X2 [Apostichopus japonicus]|uniref:inactive peptidyl-prolyl cis-trans isomerase FKBP6-like isoform X2 n=1 Tax=Stichopus japonicus TaxID=307972 RepID=UPI003AB2AB8B